MLWLNDVSYKQLEGRGPILLGFGLGERSIFPELGHVTYQRAGLVEQYARNVWSTGHLFLLK